MEITSKITKETYTNRYGDSFVFTLLKDGNIQWEGNFEYCRYGWPNDSVDIINMVDPSGGPYLTEGMKIMGKTIKEFKSNKEGYLIITK